MSLYTSPSPWRVSGRSLSKYCLTIALFFFVILGCVATASASASSLPRPSSKPSVAQKKKTTKGGGGGKSSKYDSDELAPDPIDDAIRYKGLLSCRACESILEQLAVMHHTTPMPVTSAGRHDSRSKEKKERMQIQTRNAEILDSACAELIKTKKESDDQGDVQMLQLHCDRIVGESEKRFSSFLTSLAQNTSRSFTPVAYDEPKDDKKNNKKKTPLFVHAEEKDSICKKFCVEKNSMKEQMAKMQEEIKKKQLEHMNISMYEVFSEAIGLLVGYWYVSLTAIVVLTALGLYLQVKYLAPRDANGRPILGKPRKLGEASHTKSKKSE